MSGPIGQIRGEKPVVLHELLHAYHFRVLPRALQNPDVLRFYNNAIDDGLYPPDSYVLKNVQEFFAVTASLYLRGNVDRPPHARENLRKTQPGADELPGGRAAGTFAVEVFESILYLKMWAALPPPAGAMGLKTRQSGFLCSRQPADQACNEEKNPMSKRFIATFVCSALSLIGASGFALAETFARYECSVIGSIGKEPIAGQTGHLLVSLEYSCDGVDGLMKGDVHTASSASEWIGPKGTFLRGGGVHRAPEGLAVSQITEGTGWVVKSSDTEYAGPAGTASAGKAIFKFASGNLAALSGKTFKFATKPMAPNRFVMGFTDLAPN